MKTIKAKINGKETELILVGNELDCNPRDLEDTCDGSFFDNVWMNPVDRKVYIERCFYDGALVEYNFETKILYANSKLNHCVVGAAFERDYQTEENSDSETNVFYDRP